MAKLYGKLAPAGNRGQLAVTMSAALFFLLLFLHLAFLAFIDIALQVGKDRFIGMTIT